MADTSLKDKLMTLANDQEQRVAQVGQLQEQIQQAQEAISALKEAHDHTRGKMDMIKELIDDESGSAEEKDNAKENKK